MTDKECLEYFNARSKQWQEQKIRTAACELRAELGKHADPITIEKMALKLVFHDIRRVRFGAEEKKRKEKESKIRNKFILVNGLTTQTKVMEKRNMTFERFKNLVDAGIIETYKVPHRDVPMYKLEEIPEEDDLNKYMSLRDVANRYRIHRDVVKRLAQEGFLETHSVKGSHMLWFKLDEVEPVMIEFKDKYNFRLLNKFE